MKKFILILVAVFGFGISANAQNNIIIQQNTNNNQQQDRVVVVKEQVVRGIEIEIIDNNTVRIENFNNFNVECEYKIDFVVEQHQYQKHINGDEWQYRMKNGNVGETLEGTKILQPNKPFILKRQKPIPQTTINQSGSQMYKMEFYVQKPNILKFQCYKF